MRVYLGGSKGAWREKFRRELPEVEIYDPFEDSEQLSLYQFTGEDLAGLRGCEVAFFYVDYPVYDGVCVEAGYAHALGKDVVLVFDLKGRVPPMLAGISRRIFTDLDVGLEWFKKFLADRMRDDFT